jgi:hypothetical protein
MTHPTLDAIPDEGFDREIARFLELDTINGAPSLQEMIARVAPTATQTRSRRPSSRPATPAFRLILALGLIATLILGAWAAGAWDRKGPVVVAPTPTPGPTARQLRGQIVEAGAWYADIGTVRITLHPPDGWRHGSAGDLNWFQPPEDRPALFLMTTALNVLEAPCGNRRNPPIGPTVDDLVAGLTALGLGATTPVDATVDGYRGSRLTMVAPGSVEGCVDVVDVWLNGRGSTSSYLDFGEETEIWILDVEGTRLVLRTIVLPDTTPQERAATQAMFDSIDLEPLSAFPRPSG